MSDDVIFRPGDRSDEALLYLFSPLRVASRLALLDLGIDVRSLFRTASRLRSRDMSICLVKCVSLTHNETSGPRRHSVSRGKNPDKLAACKTLANSANLVAWAACRASRPTSGRARREGSHKKPSSVRDDRAARRVSLDTP